MNANTLQSTLTSPWFKPAVTGVSLVASLIIILNTVGTTGALIPPQEYIPTLAGLNTGLAWGTLAVGLFLWKDPKDAATVLGVSQALAVALLLSESLWLSASWASVAVAFVAIKLALHAVMMIASHRSQWFQEPIVPPSMRSPRWSCTTTLDALLLVVAAWAWLQPFSFTHLNLLQHLHSHLLAPWLTAPASSTGAEGWGASLLSDGILLVLLGHSIGLSFATQWQRCTQHFSVRQHNQTDHQQLHVDLAVKTIQLEQEVATRRKAQEELHRINQDLELQVSLRTADMELILQELGQVNAQMESELNERKVLESQLVQAQKMESVGQLAAGVAHEINNPVGFILSNLRTLDEYIQLLQQLLSQYQQLESSVAESSETHPHSDAVRDILADLESFRRHEDIGFILEDLTSLLSESIDGSNRVKEIVQGLKSFSRIDESTLQEVDIHECIESTLKVVWNELKYKCNVVKQYDDALPKLLCFPGQLNQVFLNLLVNAAHAIENRGDIIIATHSEVINDTPSLVIDITDTGSGIPAKLLTKIFDPFFTTKAVGSGSGLGLAISYGIVLKHHGTLTVQSVHKNESENTGAPCGTTFTMTLPLNALSDRDATDSTHLLGDTVHDTIEIPISLPTTTNRLPAVATA